MVNEATISGEKGPLRRTNVNRGDSPHGVTRGAGVQRREQMVSCVLESQQNLSYETIQDKILFRLTLLTGNY